MDPLSDILTMFTVQRVATIRFESSGPTLSGSRDTTTSSSGLCSPAVSTTLGQGEPDTDRSLVLGTAIC